MLATARSPKILVIEDDPILREQVAACILGLGGQVVQARDGAEGLWQLEKDRPSAILLGIRTQGDDGASFLEALRADPHLTRIPVITMTGDPESDSLLPMASALRKPFDVEELARILLSLCEENV